MIPLSDAAGPPRGKPRTSTELVVDPKRPVPDRADPAEARFIVCCSSIRWEQLKRKLKISISTN